MHLGVAAELCIVGCCLSQCQDFLGLRYLPAGLRRIILHLDPAIVLAVSTASESSTFVAILFTMLSVQRLGRGQAAVAA